MTDKAELLRLANRLQDFALAEGCPTAAMRDAAAILRKLAGKPERKAQAGFDAADALAAKDAEIARLREALVLSRDAIEELDYSNSTAAAKQKTHRALAAIDAAMKGTT